MLVKESFYLLVNLLRKLAGGYHNQAIHRIFGVATIGQFVQYRQQVCGGLAGAGLGYANQVMPFKQYGYRFLLNGSALLEIHCIYGVQQRRLEIKLVKSHDYYYLGAFMYRNIAIGTYMKLGSHSAQKADMDPVIAKFEDTVWNSM